MAQPIDVLLLIAFGRVLIYLWSRFPLPEWVDNSRFGKLHHCTECAGVWIYSILFVLFRVDLLSMVGVPQAIAGGNIIGGLIGGAIISFIMSLLEVGFRERFIRIVIE